MASNEPTGDSTIWPVPEKAMGSIKERGLSLSTVQKYKVGVSDDPDNDVEAVFPRFDKESVHVANQVRTSGKGFFIQGNIKDAVLFGQNFFPEGGKSITITEGNYDAMAAFQMTGSRFPNVAVMSASSAKKEVVDAFE